MQSNEYWIIVEWKEYETLSKRYIASGWVRVRETYGIKWNKIIEWMCVFAKWRYSHGIWRIWETIHKNHFIYYHNNGNYYEKKNPSFFNISNQKNFLYISVELPMRDFFFPSRNIKNKREYYVIVPTLSQMLTVNRPHNMNQTNAKLWK